MYKRCSRIREQISEKIGANQDTRGDVMSRNKLLAGLFKEIINTACISDKKQLQLHKEFL
jgi:hypothetical protein